jgi:YVTN family beta-propeller protein
VSELPTGKISFLFTDIEGSTALLRQLGSGDYGELLAEQERVLRKAVESAGGIVFGTEGDAVFAVFLTTAAAVTAAAAAQRALAAHQWAAGVTVRVRMGINTGEATIENGVYVGLAVHLAARVAAAAHGGQVLLSDAARADVADEMPSDTGLRSLGQHRLKDFETPARLYQLAGPGLPSSFPPPRTLTTAARSRRRRLVALVAAIVAAAVLIPVFALGRGSSAVTVRPDSLVEIDPGSNRVADVVSVGARPGAVTAAAGSLWVANTEDRTVSRIDPKAARTLRTIAFADPPTAITGGRDAVWVASSRVTDAFVTVSRIDPRFNTVVATQKVERTSFQGGEGGSLAAGGGSLWLVPGSVGVVSRIDLATAAVRMIRSESCCPSGIGIGAGAVWVTDPVRNLVLRIDVRRGTARTLRVANAPSAVAVGAGAVWIATPAASAVVRIDAATGRVTRRIRVGSSPAGIAVGDGAVWVANRGDGTVSRIDPKTNRVVDTVVLRESPQGITAAAGKVWVTVQARPRRGPAVARGGVIRVDAVANLRSLDPALAYTPFAERGLGHGNLAWQILYATCAKLVNHPDAAAPTGAQLVPEVAESLPKLSRDGRTYTFRIRPGFRFSPPSHEVVSAETFKFVIERSLSPAMNGPLQRRDAAAALQLAYSFDDVVGAEAYASGKAPHITGVVARGDTLTIRLVRAAPDFLARLALPFFCAIPTDTPFDRHGIDTVASAGPYYVASRGAQVVLRRNPNYHGSRPHHADEIVITLGVTPATSTADVESGETDYAPNGPSLEQLARLQARYGARSPAARAGAQRLFVNPWLALYFLTLNAARPVFHDARLRRAVSYAVDRSKFAALAPSIPVEAADHLLPPGMPGFRDVRLYPLRSDLRTARRLAREAGGGRHRAVLYACEGCGGIAARALTRELAAIGIDIVIKEVPFPKLAAALTTPAAPFDIAFAAWGADYADPAAFLNALFGGRTTGPSSTGGRSYFVNRAYVRRLAAAARLTGQQRYLAYARLDADLARVAVPAVALAVGVQLDFFSRRIGCQIYNPIFGIDLGALCIRR